MLAITRESPTGRKMASRIYNLFAKILCLLLASSHTKADIQAASAYSQSPELYTWFYLYRTLSFEYAQVLPLFNLPVLNVSGFNRFHPTRILIHDVNGSKDAESNRQILGSYLHHQNLNIIIVDWSYGAAFSPAQYILGVGNARLAGQVIAKFLDFISAALNYSLNNVYLIGFGLGAHVAGFAGKAVQQGKVAVIFGLDPTGALFTVANNENRLAPSDAEYVEVIHTNSLGFGLVNQIGTADFYVNGGIIQPSCSLNILTCPHDMAYKVFAESLAGSRVFRVRMCRNIFEATKLGLCSGEEGIYQVGGEPARQKASGIFLVRTGYEPFPKS